MRREYIELIIIFIVMFLIGIWKIQANAIEIIVFWMIITLSGGGYYYIKYKK